MRSGYHLPCKLLMKNCCNLLLRSLFGLTNCWLLVPKFLILIRRPSGDMPTTVYCPRQPKSWSLRSTISPELNTFYFSIDSPSSLRRSRSAFLRARWSDELLPQVKTAPEGCLKTKCFFCRTRTKPYFSASFLMSLLSTD